jgi:hypothetical protein
MAESLEEFGTESTRDTIRAEVQFLAEVRHG